MQAPPGQVRRRPRSGGSASSSGLTNVGGQRRPDVVVGEQGRRGLQVPGPQPPRRATRPRGSRRGTRPRTRPRADRLDHVDPQRGLEDREPPPSTSVAPSAPCLTTSVGGPGSNCANLARVAGAPHQLRPRRRRPARCRRRPPARAARAGSRSGPQRGPPVEVERQPERAAARRQQLRASASRQLSDSAGVIPLTCTTPTVVEVEAVQQLRPHARRGRAAPVVPHRAAGGVAFLDVQAGRPGRVDHARPDTSTPKPPDRGDHRRGRTRRRRPRSPTPTARRGAARWQATLDSAPPMVRVHVRTSSGGPGSAGTNSAIVSPRQSTST